MNPKLFIAETVTIKMRIFSYIIFTLYSIANFGQDISVFIDPGDISSGQIVRTLFRGGLNKISGHCKISHDSIILETNNGVIKSDNEGKKYIHPKKTGIAIVTIRVFLNNGETIEKKQSFRVIEYPFPTFKVIEDNLVSDNTISFKLFSFDRDVTMEFYAGLFEYQILDNDKVIQEPSPCSFSVQNDTYILDLSSYKLTLKKGQELVISSGRVMWARYNLPAFTQETKIKIK